MPKIKLFLLASLYFNLKRLITDRCQIKLFSNSVHIEFPPALKKKDIYPWRDFHSDQVRIPFPSASKKSKSAFVGQSKGRSVQYVS